MRNPTSNSRSCFGEDCTLSFGGFRSGCRIFGFVGNIQGWVICVGLRVRALGRGPKGWGGWFHRLFLGLAESI